MLATTPTWVLPVFALGVLCFVAAAILNLRPVRRRLPWLMSEPQSAKERLPREWLPLLDVIEAEAIARRNAEIAAAVRALEDTNERDWPMSIAYEEALADVLAVVEGEE